MCLLLQGDARRLPLADKSVHCCVTSPPYFGLRDYGVPGQVGLEPTPDEFVAAMVTVFREVRRVLRDDGTCWINLGDSYNGGGIGGGPKGEALDGASNRGREGRDRKAVKLSDLKPKDLIGIPWRVAFALQADGWYLRSDIVWAKPNPMPESVTDRPTKSHEFVFLLAKRDRYYFDQEAVREPMAEASADRYAYGFGGAKSEALAEANKTGIGVRTRPIGQRELGSGRNIRSVWSIATEPYKGAHFATFPRKLVIPCIKAGTSQRGCCPGCGSPWRRIVERNRVATRPGLASKIYETAPLNPASPYQTHSGDICGNRDPGRHVSISSTVGWEPSCRCEAGDPVPCRVLDPFNGSGTTGVVALALGRRYVGIDLSADYLELARQRIARPHQTVTRKTDAPLPLFGNLSLEP